MRRKLLSSWGLALGLLSSAERAHAAGRDPAAAEALFAEAKTLMQSDDYARACPKLAESYRLDPAGGALYALAYCHEKEGKFASAWVEFIDAAALANAEHNSEREESARKHAESLEPRLSYVIVRVNPATERLLGLQVLRDEVALNPAAWGTPIPIDPGTHLLRAAAPGYETWSRSLSVGEGRQRDVVEIPELVPSAAQPKSAPCPAPPPVRPATARLATFGAVLTGAGASALALAGVATVRSLEKSSDSKADCHGPDGNECGPAGTRDRWSAIEAANWATAGLIVGAALVGSGVTLLVLAKSSPEHASARSERAAPAKPATTVSLRIGAGYAELKKTF